MLGSAKDAVQLIHQAKQASAPTLAFLLYGDHDAHIMPPYGDIQPPVAGNQQKLIASDRRLKDPSVVK